MEGISITVYVSEDSFMTLLNILSTVKDLPVDNDYVFTPSDIRYSETFMSSYIALNIPVLHYIKFKHKYNSLKHNLKPAK